MEEWNAGVLTYGVLLNSQSLLRSTWIPLFRTPRDVEIGALALLSHCFLQRRWWKNFQSLGTNRVIRGSACARGLEWKFGFGSHQGQQNADMQPPPEHE
ncbi:hypothetical protein AB1N83_012635 [Pleurotus pulmonarius]